MMRSAALILALTAPKVRRPPFLMCPHIRATLSNGVTCRWREGENISVIRACVV